MEPMIMLTMLVTASLHTISLAFLYDSLFERRLIKLLHWVCILAGVFILCASLIMIPMGTSLLRVAIYLMVDFIILSLFRSRFLVRMCVSVLYFLIGTALETILLPIVLLLGKLELSQLWDIPIIGTVIYTFPMALLSIATLFFARIFRGWKNQIELPTYQWLAIFLF